MADIVIDTQIAVWYFESSTRLSKLADSRLEEAVRNGETIFISAITIVEIIYLVEKGRLSQPMLERLLDELQMVNSSFRTQSLTADIARSLADIPRATVPDMPDRIIAATALHLSLPLITSDDNIQNLTNVETIW